MEWLKEIIKSVPDFPKKGVMFRDITPLLQEVRTFEGIVGGLARRYRGSEVDAVVAPEARGYIFGGALARELAAAFVPVRKVGKLPRETIRATYQLEYGTDTLEMHRDAIQPGQRVLLFDDLLATGGTMKACADLVSQLGGVPVGCAFVIELTFLQGRSKLAPLEVFSLVEYDSEAP
jgi:adenine phosphoribosyltransferase